MNLQTKKSFTINFSYVPAIAQPTENLDKKQNREKSTIENGIWAQQKCGGAFCASAMTFPVFTVDLSTIRPA